MNADDIERTLRARAAFNESVEHVDADTRQRLRAIRLHALEPRPLAGSAARWRWPAGALAAALALALFVPRLTTAPEASPASPAATASQAPTAAIASAHPAAMPTTGAEPSDAPSLETTDPEMLADLEFYGWLAKQPGTSAPGG